MENPGFWDFPLFCFLLFFFKLFKVLEAWSLTGGNEQSIARWSILLSIGFFHLFDFFLGCVFGVFHVFEVSRRVSVFLAPCQKH